MSPIARRTVRRPAREGDQCALCGEACAKDVAVVELHDRRIVHLVCPRDRADGGVVISFSGARGCR
jgi:hypothetical protein